MGKEPIRPVSFRRAVFALSWAFAVVTIVLPLPASSALYGPLANVGAVNKGIVLAQLATRGTTTNSRIPTGPRTGGPSSYGANQPGGVTPGPGRTRSIGPSTRTPTTSGPVNKRFTIDKNRLKPKADTPAKKTQSATTRKPAKTNKKQAARPKPPRNNQTAAPAAIPVPRFFPNRAVVLLADGQPSTVENALAAAYGLTFSASTRIELLRGRIATYIVPPARPLPQVVAQLEADPRVAAAQRSNLYVTVQQRKAGKASPQYALAKLRLSQAHKIAQGRDVRIAVIDTGVDRSHPSLGKVAHEFFDAVNEGDATVEDHGTGIATLIAGRGRIKGVAPGATLLAVRAFYMHPQYKRPVTSSEILLRAVDVAFKNKARIFNMSFAGAFDPLLKRALAEAASRGVIHVAAAGNGGPEAPPAYPAAYDKVIAITALDQKDRLYSHANHGSYLTAAAPGVDVLVPTIKRGYRYSSGTSLAAAHVSGVVALLLERNPKASADQILAAIRNTAHDLGPKGHDAKFGSGRADAYASLLKIAP